MSAIYGTGYGSSHDWKRGHTNQWILGQVFSYEDGAGFSHQYDVIPDIFEAIKLSGVPDKCPDLSAEEGSK